jgi:hypothetical protein
MVNKGSGGRRRRRRRRGHLVSKDGKKTYHNVAKETFHILQNWPVDLARHKKHELTEAREEKDEDEEEDQDEEDEDGEEEEEEEEEEGEEEQEQEQEG